MRNNRKKAKASGIYQIEPLFLDEDMSALLAGDATHYIDGRLGDHLIVSVPETTTSATAIELEREIEKVAKKPVLVVTHNVAFLRATLLTGKEKEALEKVLVENAEPTPPEDAPAEKMN